MQLNKQTIASAASAGLNLINRDTTLIPGSLRQQVAVLEALLGHAAQTGTFPVAQKAPETLPLEPETPDARKRPAPVDPYTDEDNVSGAV